MVGCFNYLPGIEWRLVSRCTILTGNRLDIQVEISNTLDSIKPQLYWFRLGISFQKPLVPVMGVVILEWIEVIIRI
jgi:hypothetical protein